jgi:hypothetical protein
MPHYFLRIHGSGAPSHLGSRDYPDLASAMARGNRVVSGMLAAQGGDALLLKACLDIEDDRSEIVARILFADVAARTGKSLPA